MNKEEIEFLREVAEKLMRVPVMYGLDGWHIDQLNAMTSRHEKKLPHPAIDQPQ